MIKLLNLKTSYSIGKNAENQACDYLQKKGYKIVKQNYKTKIGEIDVLASKKDILIAIEVKYRKDEYNLPYVISAKQMARIQDALLLFQQNNQEYKDYNLRFDAIFISKNNINHIENAWESLY